MVKQNIEGLKPLGTDPVYDKSVRDKLKGSGSQKRKEAQQLRRLREMPPEKVTQRALELATDPSKTALEIMRMIVALKEKGNLEPSMEIQLIRSLNDSYRTIFGNKNFNLNVQLDMNAVAKEIMHHDAARHAFEVEHLEGVYPIWKKNFGKEVAEEMKAAVEYKWGIGLRLIENGVHDIKEVWEQIGKKGISLGWKPSKYAEVDTYDAIRLESTQKEENNNGNFR